MPGHNPLGALSVLVLLGLLLTQIVLGLFAVDVDGIESGPLSTYVSFDTGRVAAEWHEALFDVLLWLIGLHVAAVLFYLLYKKENLVGTMLHGMRAFPSGQVTPVRTASWRALRRGRGTGRAVRPGWSRAKPSTALASSSFPGSRPDHQQSSDTPRSGAPVCQRGPKVQLAAFRRSIERLPMVALGANRVY